MQPSPASDATIDSADTLQDGSYTDGAAPAPLRPHLFVVFESDRPLAGGARYDLAGIDEVVIGRGPERTAEREVSGGVRRLQVKIPGRWMSNVHARFRCCGTHWILDDAGSTNGSFVNGHRVHTSTIVDADCIELGHTLFCLRSALPTPPGTPQNVDASALSTKSASTQAEGPELPEARGLISLLPELAFAHGQVVKVARSSVSIVLIGATGTGKEVLARAIHAVSGRAGAFVAVHCGAVTSVAPEIQLLGQAQGASAGDVQAELGFVRSADHGTLFFDEVGELPKSAQVALLRVLQEREVVPVGSARPVPVDLRIVVAEDESLAALSARGLLRDDLRGRLDGYTVRLPTLFQRREDLGILIADWLTSLGAGTRIFRSPVARLLWSYRWPLNIRELRHALDQALVLADKAPIDMGHLPPIIAASAEVDARQSATAVEPPLSSAGASQSAHVSRRVDLSDRDLEYRNEVIRRLEEHHGNIAAVAKSMGKARMQIHRWLRRFGIDPAIYRESRAALRR